MSDGSVPVGGFNFQVHVAEVDERGDAGPAIEIEAMRVVLPVFRCRPVAARPDAEPDLDGDRLVVQRGHTGSTELHDWWSDEHDPKYRGRVVSVVVLDRDLLPVTVWRFEGCHLAELRYSPLDALESAVLTETVEIGFESVRQLPIRG